MKVFLVKLFFFFVVLLNVHSLDAQQHDNIWLLGYASNTVDSTYGGSVLNFSTDTLNVYYQYRDIYFDVTNASVCDTIGNLLFYTNGISIMDASHDIMENGAGLNPGEYADDHLGTGYILNQGAMVIPVPESDNLFYLLHTSKEYPNSQIDWHSPEFYYSLIDISLNNGLGSVVEKNQIIIADILDSGKITSTKHANGRDWWVILKEHDTNGYYRILITPDEIINFGIQNVGVPFTHGLGQATFSPDGSKYVLYNLIDMTEGNYLNIYNFDRCSGLLSNHVLENIIDSAWSGGVAISSNSQFLYVSSYEYIYQYDLMADDILATKDTVAIYDGYIVEVTPTFQLPTRFFLMQLGPDGRIYINSPAAVNVLHVIENPNEAGDACNVNQHGIQLPTYNAFSMPNFPNYRLGALPEGSCDTTSSVSTQSNLSSTLLISPNPASESLTIELSTSKSFKYAKWEVYTSTGYAMASGSMAGQLVEISVINWPAGVYFVKVTFPEGSFITKKVIVQ